MPVERTTPQLVKKGKGKKRPGYRGPGGYQGGRSSSTSSGKSGNTGTGNRHNPHTSSGYSKTTTVSGNRMRSSARETQQAINNARAIEDAKKAKREETLKNTTRFGYQKPKTKLGGLGSLIMSGLGMLMGIPGLGLLTGGLDKLKGGLGSLNETLGDFREKTTGYRTQAEYDAARQQRQLQGRLDNLYDRKAKGKGFSQKNIDMLESQYGLSPSTAQNVLTGRDLKGFTPSRMGLQTIDKPTQTFSFDSSGMMKNQPTMMEEFYSNLDNRVTGPNIVPNASDLAIQAKTFNTPEALMGMAGATEPGTIYGTNLSDQGKALEDFRNSAVNFYNSPNNPAKTAQSAYDFMMGTNPNMFKDVKENKSFIQDAINQGFLQTEDDYANQVPLDQIDLKDGGIASMFTRRG